MNRKQLPAALIGARPEGLRSEVSPEALKRWRPELHALAPKADDAAFEIDVLEVIGEDFWGEGVTARKVSALLRMAAGREVVVNINSPGGNFFEGTAIYNALRDYGGRVTVKILGVAASAASIIAMAGDEVLIARAGFVMIHNTWVVAAGDRRALRETADWLEPFDEVQTEVFVARTGLPAQEISRMLDAETWLSGREAVERGFADGHLGSDTVVEGDEPAREATQASAYKRVDALLAQGKPVPRAERRALLRDLKSGTPSAAADGKPSAAEEDAFAALLATVKSTRI